MTSDSPYIPKKPAGTENDPYDPLQYFIALFDGRKADAPAVKKRADTIEDVLKDRIHAQLFDNHYVLINQDLNQTHEKINAILKAERLKRVRQEGMTDSVAGL